jgi:hypothetical protein
MEKLIKRALLLAFIFLIKIYNNFISYKLLKTYKNTVTFDTFELSFGKAILRRFIKYILSV